MTQRDMIYFIPGELVRIKQEMNFKPNMVVKSIDKMKTRNEERSQLLGVLCFWFTKDGLYQEARFNTKDLEKVE